MFEPRLAPKPSPESPAIVLSHVHYDEVVVSQGEVPGG